MRSGHPTIQLLLLLIGTIPAWAQAPATRPATPHAAPDLLTRPDFFPLAVWLQDPKNAAAYREIGINLYIGLWKGPTENQLLALERAGMPVICAPTEYGLKHQSRRIIVGWMHDDEPDNAQSLGEGKGYGPPIKPEKVRADYQRIRKLDPTRPVLLNLGQGVAWDNWHGRGTRTRHPEDYPEYAQGADILSFDIYPVTHDREEVRGHLWFVGQGVERLRRWSGEQKPVWACIETTHISNPEVRPTPEQIRSMVWMALVHGAGGLVYFAHEFKPKFVEAGILAYPDIREAVKEINGQITELAPVLNSPTIPGAVAVSSSNSAVPIHTLTKRHQGATFVFALAMRAGETTGSFSVPELTGDAMVTVLGENRTIRAQAGRWRDAFSSYAVHLYKVTPAAPSP